MIIFPLVQHLLASDLSLHRAGYGTVPTGVYLAVIAIDFMTEFIKSYSRTVQFLVVVLNLTIDALFI